MPDIRNAMRNAGLGGGGPERRCEKCGKMFIPKDTRHRHCDDCFAKERDHQRGSNASLRRLDFLLGHPDYPAYFDNDGILKCEYLTDLAEKWAKVFGERRLTTHQLRAFYGHAKRQQAAIEAGRSFREIYPEICKLKAFAAERADKEKIPIEFKEFICRNVDKATDQKAFLSGFMEHFQAIVAYCAGTLKY
jgi:CRISPR type III-A-associated protein Csm2